MSKPAAYHHGNLREALLRAGIELLEEKGANGFSLRACAARAGVSHAAPAHHFGDMRALLTALATIAFERFGAAMRHERTRAGTSTFDQIRAAGQGYLTFASENPALFKLMFDAEKLDWDDPVLRRASAAAYQQLEEISAPVSGAKLAAEQAPLYVWSMVHGYAHLKIAGQIDRTEDQEEAFLDGFVAMLCSLSQR